MRIAALLFLVGGLGCAGPAKNTAQTGVATDEEPIAPGAGRIEGVVSGSDGSGVSLANVYVARPGATEPIGDSISDGGGKYTLANLDPGTYRVIATHSSLRTEAHGVVVLANTATALNLRLAPDSTKAIESREDVENALGVISGDIFDKASGEPLGGATIEIAGAALRESIFTLADERGKFIVRGLEPATYTVSIYYSLIDKGNVEVRRSGVVVEQGVATKLRLEIDADARN